MYHPGVFLISMAGICSTSLSISCLYYLMLLNLSTSAPMLSRSSTCSHLTQWYVPFSHCSNTLMKRQSCPTSHRQTNAQPAPEQRIANFHELLFSLLVAEHVVIWHGIFLRSFGVICLVSLSSLLGTSQSLTEDEVRSRYTAQNTAYLSERTSKLAGGIHSCCSGGPRVLCDVTLWF